MDFRLHASRLSHTNAVLGEKESPRTCRYQQSPATFVAVAKAFVLSHSVAHFADPMPANRVLKGDRHARPL